jgi:hypothetical protein
MAADEHLKYERHKVTVKNLINSVRARGNI